MTGLARQLLDVLTFRSSSGIESTQGGLQALSL